MQQVWDSSDYARHGRFVAEMAGTVVDLLDPQPGERILDLGCGDGFLTRRIADSGAEVLGIDSSPAMVASAIERGVDARCASGEALDFSEEFDAVFSNAALHWIRDQDAVLAGVARALKPGGRFVAECGGQGNIAAIRVALLAVLSRRGIRAERIESNYFHSPAEYQTLLERHGFRIEQITLTARPTPLANGITGWLATFRRSLFDELPDAERSSAIEEVAGLLRPVLQDKEGNWFADYVRLRFVAYRL
jgi:trans-aconitate methyltransferase